MPTGRIDIRSKEDSGNDLSGRDWEESCEVLLCLGKTDNHEDIMSVRHVVYLVAQMEVGGQICFLTTSPLEGRSALYPLHRSLHEFRTNVDTLKARRIPALWGI
jgi:hypothetical protein